MTVVRDGSVGSRRGRRVGLLLGSVLVPVALAVAAPVLVVRSQVARWGLLEDDARLEQDLVVTLVPLAVVVALGLLAGWLWGRGSNVTASVVACVAVRVAAVPTLGLLSLRFAGDVSPVLTSEVALAVGCYRLMLGSAAAAALLTATWRARRLIPPGGTRTVGLHTPKG
ncbi:hypothetical protein GCM10009737_01680 [Nocardioides lentus]|uniref:Integral membrane protein n=1 Tax=Nocardioides lentus TaxID=338077 RepID=A0ABN2NW31_9ACTN